MKIMHDLFGHCVMCHKNLLTEQVIGMKVQQRFTPDKDRIRVLLDDGSQMGVTICRQCKETYTEEDNKDIMKSVVKGWKMETEQVPHWSKEKKEKHMEVYSKKKIVIRSDGLDKNTLNKKLKKYKEK